MQRNMKSGNLGEKYMWRGFLMLIYHYVTLEKVYETPMKPIVSAFI